MSVVKLLRQRSNEHAAAMSEPIKPSAHAQSARRTGERDSRHGGLDTGRKSSKRPVEDFEETRLLNDPRDRLLGDLLREAEALNEEQVEAVLEYQREHDVRFGVAAIQLGYTTEKDVLFALARQFRYPYALEGSDNYNPELVMGTDPFGEQAESFRELRSQLLQGAMGMRTEGRRPALAVVSPNVGDGKTFFAANLATAFSQLGGRTVLIDADMRTPRQHTLFGVDGQMGLSNVLAGRTKKQVVHRVPGIPSLYVMPVGAVPPNPLELVQSMAFSLLVREMRHRFDYVIVDTPAATHGADCRVIAVKCGAALAIARQGRTKMPELNSLVSKLSKGSHRLAGIVMNEW
jgi:chain length determinant protein tyrosine kinase EpsG